MLDWILVDTPTLLPNKCFGCGSQKGPIADTHVELGGWRVYVCQGCAKRGARLFGFADGERMEKLSRANDDLTAIRRELQIARVEKDELTGQLVDSTKRAEAALAVNVDLRQENERLKMELDGIANTARSLSSIG